MKILLLVIAIDTLAVVVGTLIWKKLKPAGVTEFLRRKGDDRAKIDPDFRSVWEILRRGRELLSHQPAWAVAQGLTLYEELEARRYFNALLVSYCGTDDIFILTAAVRGANGQSLNIGVDDQLRAWGKFVSARPGAEDRG